MDIINNILGSFMAFFAQYLVVFQLTSFLVSAGLIALIVYFLLNTDTVIGPIDHLTDIFGFRDVSHGRALRAWKQIKKRLSSSDKKQWRLAVVEADAIFDETLKISGYNGKTFDERLEAANHTRFFSISVEEIKEAHRLKDRIVSEPEFSVSLNEVEVIVKMYKNAYKELCLS
ncbi:MAG: hypothetical protein ABIH10_01460 [Spirochaetota bacterium]